MNHLLCHFFLICTDGAMNDDFEFRGRKNSCRVVVAMTVGCSYQIMMLQSAYIPKIFYNYGFFQYRPILIRRCFITVYFITLLSFVLGS